MKRVIAVINQKGGVGKTTLTFNLVKELANTGKKILVIDNDPQANLTSCFLNDPTALTKTGNIFECYQEDATNKVIPLFISNNIWLLGADIHLAKVIDKGIEVIYLLKEYIEKVKDHYDFLFIDCLPAFGHLNLAALNAADFALIPTKPSPFSLAGLKDLFDNIHKVKKRINPNLEILGIVLNLVEGRTTRMAKEIEIVLREAYPQYIFKSLIKKGIKLEESPAANMSIIEYEPQGKDSMSFKEFINEFLMKYKELNYE